MRTLKFIVHDQIIEKDPNCDFDNLVPGTAGYIQASFSFSSEWTGCLKVAGFYSQMGTEYEPQFIDDRGTCMIPAEALKRRIFKIQVIGLDTINSRRLTTNRLEVCQNGGRT